MIQFEYPPSGLTELYCQSESPLGSPTLTRVLKPCPRVEQKREVPAEAEAALAGEGGDRFLCGGGVFVECFACDAVDEAGKRVICFLVGDVFLVERRREHFTWERCACSRDGGGQHFQACKLPRPEREGVEDGVALLRGILILE